MSLGFEAQPANFRTSVMNIERPGDPTVFSAQVKADALEIIARYPAGQSRSALLPMLHLVQSEQGYITPDGIAFCADILEITKAQVAAVATFYTMYKRKPTGEYLVSVCTNTLCGLLGGDDIYAALSDSLGVGMNDTTADGKITLEHAECLAACDYGPVVTVNYEFFDNQTVDSAGAIVQELRSGGRPLPTRGAPLCSFKEISRQIAGFLDDRPEAQGSSATGTPTEAGVTLAISKGESAPSYAAATSRPAEPPVADAPKAAAPVAAAPAPAAPPAAPASAAAPTPEAPKAGAVDAAQTEAQAAPAGRPNSSNDAPLQTSASDPAADASQPAAALDDDDVETPTVSAGPAATSTNDTANDTADDSTDDGADDVDDDEQAARLAQMPGLETAAPPRRPSSDPSAPARRRARARVRKPQSDELSFGDDSDPKDGA